MSSRKRHGIKKTVSFSDDEAFLRRRSSKNENKRMGLLNPPVYVRKTIGTVPIHLPGLTYYYLKISNDFDTVRLLYMLIVTQLLFLVFQFNRNTIYGNKRLKIHFGSLAISIVACFLLTLPCMLLIVLMGAPFGMLLWETWLLAAHCCFLAFPAVYSVFNCDFKVGVFKNYFLSICIGCWVSCVVIPLDWDRPWQEWPIPLVVGGYLGAFVGYTICSYV
ncbi:LAMI_0D04478g1_1 [Lachancea mirantina]|uniref:Glycosylphosphatidylinositol anchor biosynthesis protein 11 n=1 Tax=Lachancea mirantina TaxID=1230905 RepID=A0A1G4JAF6_9SACH|nr:LAMI_0D04478g1_1 [Lachancea mirantina]